ncbi:MAG: GNAT family N-acetyltransferase [Candidatus Cloacimonetes bacterium]|nr:GNAT family N-acetyltransferase [Candidatus Cloacimonadota bacterium]
MEIRKITRDETKKYHRLSQYAFGSWQNKDIEEERINWMNPEECYVIIEDGEMISGLISHSLKQSVRGTVKKLSGIGNVATYPEYRNKGCVKELFKYTFKEMKAVDQAVSMLQPFKESFYNKFGYVSTNREINLKFHVDGIQHYLSKTPEDWTVERKTGLSAQKEFNAFFFREAVNWHGMVISDEIYQGFSEHLAKDTIYILVKYKNDIKAVCCYKKQESVIRINNIFWQDIAARKVLFNFLARHRDQVGNFEMFIPMGTNFYSWFSDMKSQYELKMCEGPWMVRIIDIKSAFSDLKLISSSNVTMEVKDDMCDWNNGKYKLAVKDGKSNISRCKQSSKADVTGDIKGYSALLYGALSLEEICDKGWLQVNDSSIHKILQEWFPQLLLFNTFMF